MKELKEFVRLSKYAGERLDLIQAGGGNSSVKLNTDIMLIKASGFMLSEVELDQGYLKVKYQKVTEILENKRLLSLKDKERRNRLAVWFLGKTTAEKFNKPSIETFLHALLYKYTLHTHPLVVNAIISQKNWREILHNLFGGDIVAIDYRTPGVELALELKVALKEYQEKYEHRPKTIFIQNHGLIISSDNPGEIIRLTEEILRKLEGYLRINLKKYKMTNRISALVNSLKNTYDIAYLSTDIELNRLIKSKRDIFFKPPFCPDILVYCGISALEAKNLKDSGPFVRYYKKYGQTPKVVIYNNYVFFIARNLNKAKGIADVFKFGILALGLAKKKINFLSKDELLYLSNWQAEKYRQCR